MIKLTLGEIAETQRAKKGHITTLVCVCLTLFILIYVILFSSFCNFSNYQCMCVCACVCECRYELKLPPNHCEITNMLQVI